MYDITEYSSAQVKCFYFYILIIIHIVNAVTLTCKRILVYLTVIRVLKKVYMNI